MEFSLLIYNVIHNLRSLSENFIMKFVMSVIVSTVMIVVGDMPDAYQLLVALLLLDLLVGLAKAIKKRNVSLHRACHGLVKIILYSVAIITGIIIDRSLFHCQVQFGFAYALNSYLVVHTGISIIKNLQVLGVPIPKNVLVILEKSEEKLGKPAMPS